jgi:hypothetical protein
MGIYAQVNQDIKTAMKSKDKPRLLALRGIRAAFIEKQKQDNSEAVSDPDCVKILRRLGKQRRDSVQAYREGDREDLADAEQAELSVIEVYLPSLADEATTRGWVEEAIAATGASGPSDMGKVMGVLMKNHREDMDGSLASRLVQSYLKS